MKRSLIFFILMMLACSSLFADDVRVYCHDSSVSVEHRPDQNYTAENVTIKNVPWFVIDRGLIPEYKYSEQLRCQGDSLIVDHDFVPERIVRRNQIKQTEAALDAELGKAEPDVITVLRLQRSIERLRKD